LQNGGCASRPLRPVGHDLAHKRRHWIDVDDVLDRVAPTSRVPAGRNALSHAVAQSTKSAIRGNRLMRTRGRICNPCAAASRRAPRMCGRASSNSRQSAVSGRRCRSAIGASISRMARSARSARVIMSSLRRNVTATARTNCLFAGGKNGAHETMALARLVAGAPGKTVSYEFVLSHLWQELERYDNLEARLRSLEFQTSVAMAAASRFQRAIR
jgi:hypothetical protein